MVTTLGVSAYGAPAAKEQTTAMTADSINAAAPHGIVGTDREVKRLGMCTVLALNRTTRTATVMKRQRAQTGAGEVEIEVKYEVPLHYIYLF